MPAGARDVVSDLDDLPLNLHVRPLLMFVISWFHFFAKVFWLSLWFKGFSYQMYLCQEDVTLRR